MYAEYVPKSNAPKPINWVAVRAEYELGGISLRQLADKLKVSTRTLERRSSKESWREGIAKVSAKCREEVTNKVIAQKVENTLSDLDMINNIIRGCYDAYQERPDSFKTSGENVAAIDRMLKTKLEYSDEHIQKWLLSRGYVAVPIAEFAPSDEMGEIKAES